MSHSNTTQDTPQWAIDAAREYRGLGRFSQVCRKTNERNEYELAAIIASHAPRQILDEAKLMHMAAEAERGAANNAARIAELEAENARLREYKYGLSYALMAVDNLLRKDWTNQLAVVLSMAIDIELGSFIAENNLNKDWNKAE